MKIDGVYNLRFSFFTERAGRSPLLCLIAVFLAVLLCNGFATTDGGDFLLISRDPLRLLAAPERQFLYSSPLNFFFAFWFGLDSLFGFFLIHIAEIIGMLFCVGIALRKKFAAPEQQILFILLLALTPLWLVVVKWIGKTDPILVGGFALCWAFPSRWRAAVAAVMILAHREIGTLMCLSLYILEDKKDHRLLAPILGANGAHLLYQYGILDHAPRSRPESIAIKSAQYLAAFSRIPALYVMSMFSWYWILVMLKKPAIRESLLMLLAFVVALLNEDFTRDFTLVVLPALFFHLARVVEDPAFARFGKLAPLSLVHFQIAAMGQIYMAGNIFLLWLTQAFKAGAG